MVITEGNLPTAEWIESLLRANGWNIESSLEIDSIHPEERGRGDLVHISLHRTGSAQIPNRLLLKTRPEQNREACFYQHNRASSLPIPRCFAVQAGPPSAILIEDLSFSHADISDWPTPLPQLAFSEVLDAIARFHAANWDPAKSPAPQPRLPEYAASQTAYQAYLGYLKRDAETYIQALGARLGPVHQRLVHDVLAYLPKLWEDLWEPRLASRKNLPLIHADLNPCNVLYPRQSGDPVVLIDWEACRQGLPAEDLAMLLGLHLCPNYDEALPLLQTYYSGLLNAGVRGYSFDDLLEDYQIALLYDLFYPMKLFSQAGIDDQAMLENAFLALETINDAI